MHTSQIQGCIVEQRVEKKRKIAESMWVHNVVTVVGLINSLLCLWNASVLSSLACVVQAF